MCVGAGCGGAGMGARPDRTTDQGRRPNRAPPPVIRRRFHDGAIPPEQAVRLVAARRISPEATYGCGSAPESDRLPLLRWVKLCPHPSTQVAPRQSPSGELPRPAVSRPPPLSSTHDYRTDVAPRADNRRRSTRFRVGQRSPSPRQRTAHPDRRRQPSCPRSHQAHRGRSWPVWSRQRHLASPFRRINAHCWRSGIALADNAPARNGRRCRPL